LYYCTFDFDSDDYMTDSRSEHDLVDNVNVEFSADAVDIPVAVVVVADSVVLFDIFDDLSRLVHLGMAVGCYKGFLVDIVDLPDSMENSLNLNYRMKIHHCVRNAVMLSLN